MEEFEGNVIEANVLNQISEVGSKKPCKTCKNKGLSGSNVKILTLGFGILFTSCYGIVKIVQDVFHFFTH